jgi:hypothetical protein
MSEEQKTKAVEVSQNARQRLVDAQASGHWFQFVFSMNEAGEITSGWDGSHFRCDAHDQVLAYVDTELKRLRAECQCCRAKREAELANADASPA